MGALTPGKCFKRDHRRYVWQSGVGGTSYTLANSRIKGREGPRVAGSNRLIDGSYIEASGAGQDHGDGIQCYTGGRFNTDNVVIRNTYVKMTPGVNNGGIFFADYCNADLTLRTSRLMATAPRMGPSGFPATGRTRAFGG